MATSVIAGGDQPKKSCTCSYKSPWLKPLLLVLGLGQLWKSHLKYNCVSSNICMLWVQSYLYFTRKDIFAKSGIWSCTCLSGSVFSRYHISLIIEAELPNFYTLQGYVKSLIFEISEFFYSFGSFFMHGTCSFICTLHRKNRGGGESKHDTAYRIWSQKPSACLPLSQYLGNGFSPILYKMYRIKHNKYEFIHGKFL